MHINFSANVKLLHCAMRCSDCIMRMVRERAIAARLRGAGNLASFVGNGCHIFFKFAGAQRARCHSAAVHLPPRAHAINVDIGGVSPTEPQPRA